MSRTNSPAKTFIRSLIARVVLSLLPFTLLAQLLPRSTSTPAASLSGSVRDESNLPIASATVNIASHGARFSGASAADGSFNFSNLKTGMWFVCAVPPPGTTAAHPYVNSCLWHSSSSLQVPLAPGQVRTGVTVPVTHGYPLDIRVNDPIALLPATTGKTGGNELSIHVISPSGLAHPVPIASKDAKGRDHVLVVPYNTPLKLLIHSSSFTLKDAVGNALAPTTTTSFTIPTNGAVPAFTINVDHPIP